MAEPIFSPETKEWLGIISGIFVLIILPLITWTFRQGKNEILTQISNLSMNFSNHIHNIDCSSCKDAKTKDLFVIQPKRRSND